MRKDDILINGVIEEAGLLSRTAARAKALGGAAKQAIGDVGTAIVGKKPAADAGWRDRYTQGKQEQILKTLSNDIIKDLTKLKLVPAGSPLNPTDLQNTLTQYISKYTGVSGEEEASTQEEPTQEAPTQEVPAPQNTPTPQIAPQTSPQAAPTPEAYPTPQATPQVAPTQDEAPQEQEEAPEEKAQTPSIPLGSVISGRVGNKQVTYRYSSPEEVAEDNKLTPNPNANPENAKWYSLSKNSKMAFDDVDNDIQPSISSAWEKKISKEQAEQKKASTPTFEESFKNYFWK
jgi:hypothetical protein